MHEQTIWKGGTSQLVNFGFYLSCLLFSWLIIPILAAIWRWFVTRGDQYELTTERFITKNGVFNLRQDQLELYRVKDISNVRPFLYRIFGLSTIEMHTDDVTTPLVLIIGIPHEDAARLENAIRTRVEAERNRRARVIST